MAKRKTKTTKKPIPHCKNVKRSDGSKRKMCWDGKGKITSAAKVAAYNKRTRTKKAA